MTKHRRFIFQFNQSDRDRVIMSWVDNVKEDPNVNISEIIKDHLYTVAIGQTDDPTIEAIRDVIRAEFAKLPAMIRVQGGSEDDAPADPNDAGEIERRLGAMLD